MFILEVHHGGYFYDGLYIGGFVHWIDGQDVDEVSMLELNSFVRHFGYELLKIKFHYKHRTRGWVQIKGNNDYFDAVQLVKGKHLFVIYFSEESTEHEDDVQRSDDQVQEEFPEYDADVELEDILIQEADDTEFWEREKDEQEEEEEDDDDDGEVNEDEEVDEEEEDEEYRETDFEQSDEEDERGFHRYVVTEDVVDHHKEPSEVETDEEYNTEDLDSLTEENEEEDEEQGKRRNK